MTAHGEFEQQLAEIANALESADKYFNAGRFDDAARTFDRALYLLEDAFGRLDPDTIACLQKLAEAKFLSGRYEDALPLYKRLLSVGKEVLGPNHPDVKAMALKVEETAQLCDGRANAGAAAKIKDDRSARLSHSSIDALKPEHVPADDWNSDWKTDQYDQSRKSRGLEYESEYQEAAAKILDAARSSTVEKFSDDVADKRFDGRVKPENKPSGRAGQHDKRSAAKGKIQGMKPNFFEAGAQHFKRLMAFFPAILVISILGGGVFYFLKFAKAPDPKATTALPRMVVKKFVTADDARQIVLIENKDKVIAEVKMTYAGIRQPLLMPFLQMGPSLFDFLKSELNCLTKKDIWFEETKEGLLDEKGVTYYAVNAPELIVVGQMKKLRDSANKWYLGGTGYPMKAEYVNAFSYVNPITAVPTHPSLVFQRTTIEDARSLLLTLAHF
ncbi:MAG: tetratricopeptide repeat protein, partial [Leptolyngbya sp.]|nr:tetratricopeptide repeat protein [Candidatus Melainabacteria bacterium]